MSSVIGEIRDAETARMALRAALTGHLVFATLHAGSALSAFSRLHELGVERQQLQGNLIGIVAQRLFRTPCACQLEHAADGCALCHHSGYRGSAGLAGNPAHRRRTLDLLLATAGLPEFVNQPPREPMDSVPLAEAARVRSRARRHGPPVELARIVDLTDVIAGAHSHAP